MGYICAECRLFEIRNKIVSSLFFAFALLIACVAARLSAADSAAYNFIDMFITAPFIYSICVLSEYIKVFRKALLEFGKASTYMWLVHTFYCYYYFQKIITAGRISLVMYAELIVISFLTAKLLMLIERLVDKALSKTMVKERV